MILEFIFHSDFYSFFICLRLYGLADKRKFHKKCAIIIFISHDKRASKTCGAPPRTSAKKNDGKSSIAKCISKEKQCDQIERTERCTTATDVPSKKNRMAWITQII